MIHFVGGLLRRSQTCRLGRSPDARSSSATSPTIINEEGLVLESDSDEGCADGCAAASGGAAAGGGAAAAGGAGEQ